MPTLSSISLIILSFFLMASGGCQNDEEECRAARAAAVNAWSAAVEVTQPAAVAAQEAYAAGEEPARNAREATCEEAWTTYGVVLSEVEEPGASAIDPRALVAVGPDNRCQDTRSDGVMAQERAALIARHIPLEATEERDEALREANQAYETIVTPLRSALSESQRLNETSEFALDRARGPATEARDASQAVPNDGAAPEVEAAIAASEESWEACQGVDP